MYYTTVRVQTVEGHEHEAIDEAIKHGMSLLAAEANVPIVLKNVVSVSLPSCLCLVIMAEKYDPPIRFSEVRGVQIDDALIRTKSRFL